MVESTCVFCCTLMEFSSLAYRTAVQHATSDPAYRYVSVCRAATSCSLQLHHLLPCTANVHVNTLTSSSSPPRFFLFSEPSLHVFAVAWFVHSRQICAHTHICVCARSLGRLSVPLHLCFSEQVAFQHRHKDKYKLNTHAK